MQNLLKKIRSLNFNQIAILGIVIIIVLIFIQLVILGNNAENEKAIYEERNAEEISLDEDNIVELNGKRYYQINEQMSREEFLKLEEKAKNEFGQDITLQPSGSSIRTWIYEDSSKGITEIEEPAEGEVEF